MITGMDTQTQIIDWLITGDRQETSNHEKLQSSVT